jgi:TolA-binding protein
MWLWLLIQTALLQNVNLECAGLTTSSIFCFHEAGAADTSTGPTSQEEANVLWNDGKAAYDAEEFAKAIPLFQRLVDRYPGFSGYLEAHRYLGRAYLFNDQAKLSIPPLRYYITATADRELSLRARIWLAEANLATGNPHEAFLSSIEIEKSPSADPQTFAEGEIMKAHTLIALKEDERAQKVLDAVKQKPIVDTDPVLKGQAAQVELQLKIHDCEKPITPSPKVGLDELKVQDAYSRRAICLQEALLLVRHAVDAAGTGKDLMTLKQAQGEILRGFIAYNHAIQNPPLAAHNASQTTLQKNQYKAELVDHLRGDQRRTYQEATASLTTWKKEATALSIPVYDDLIQKLQTLWKASTL